MKPYEFDPKTRIGHVDSQHVGSLTNEQIKDAALILGRGNVILKDRMGGRVGQKCTPEVLAQYQRGAA